MSSPATAFPAGRSLCSPEDCSTAVRGYNGVGGDVAGVLSDEPKDDVWSGVRLGPVLLLDVRVVRASVGMAGGLPNREGEDSRERLGELGFDLGEVVATVFDRFTVEARDVGPDFLPILALFAFPSGADSSPSVVSLDGE